MTQTRVECAEARLHKVESELRLIKRLLFVGASSFLIAALAGAGLLSRVPQHVEASEGFVLRDRQGQTRAFLGFEPHGTPTLLFFDKNNTKARIAIAANHDGPTGFFLRPRGKG